MLRPLVVFIALEVALSDCATVKLTRRQQEERAKVVALRYLTERQSNLPRVYTIQVSRSEWIPEFVPSEIIYVVNFNTRQSGKVKTLYSVPVSAERFEVMTFGRMGVLTPLND
jgi:hypothetical protein